MNYFLTALLIFMAATATSAQKQIVTSKCGCSVHPIHHEYNLTSQRSKDSVVDILISKEVNDWVVIDYMHERVTTPNGSHACKIKSLIAGGETVVLYAQTKLTIYYKKVVGSDLKTVRKYDYHTVEDITDL